MDDDDAANGADNRAERPQTCQPQSSAEHQHSPADRTFSRDDPADIAPWWSVNQAMVWVATRIASYVEYIGSIEGVDREGTGEFRPYIVQAMCGIGVAGSDEGKAFAGSHYANWAEAAVLARAGRVLLESIRTGNIHPIAREQGQSRQMDGADFAGIGNDKTGVDWLRLRPCPIFSSAEVIAVFPSCDDTQQAFTVPLPATLPEIGPVMALDEALSLLAHGKPSYDTEMWQNAAGDLIFRDPSGAVIELRADGSAPPSVEKYRRASRTIHGVLRDGSLPAYVAPTNGVPLLVPRYYWNSVNPERLHHVYRGMTPGGHGAGCPVLLCRQSFDAWRVTVPLIKAQEKSRVSHGDVVDWCRHWIKSGKGNGMDKAWKDFQADSECRGLSRDDVFRPAWREAKTR